MFYEEKSDEMDEKDEDGGGIDYFCVEEKLGGGDARTLAQPY